MHWPEDIRRQCRVPRFDPGEFDSNSRRDGEHKVLPYVNTLADARVPIALIGPKGTGKSYIARQLAERREVPFGYCPMTAGATPSWLTGAYTLDGFKTRPLIEIYKHGGVFVFEELDAADPNMTIVVNNLLSDDVFFNPQNGERIEKHADFIPVCGMNTLGLGGGRSYTGRSRLDAATLDRWAPGRVSVPVDEKLEMTILRNIVKS
jgi:MoxR-like ATPase